MAELEPARLNCPACQAPILLPLTQQGAYLTSITLTIDLNALRRHIATAHPQEPPMATILDRFHAVVATLEAEGHHLADEARTVFSHFEKEAAAVVGAVTPVLNDLRTGVTADVKAVIDEAKTEAADVVARIEAAVAKLEALVKQPPAGS